jgi:hypothetical protein
MAPRLGLGNDGGYFRLGLHGATGPAGDIIAVAAATKIRWWPKTSFIELCLRPHTT